MSEDYIAQRSKAIIESINKMKKRRRRIKYALILCAVLWSSYAGKIIAQKMYYDKVMFSEAFSGTKASTKSCMLEIMGELKGITDTEEKLEFIEKIAGLLGITGGEIKYSESDKTYLLTTVNGVSETVIKCAEINNSEYMYVRIKIYGSGINDIAYFREQLENYSTKQEIKIISNQILFEGEYPGKLSTQEKDAITQRVFDKMSAKENARYTSEDGLYTVYAYSAGISDYIVAGGLPVNVQISAYYDEKQDKTIIYVGSPIVNVEY